jgi:hypothetical protein
MPLNFPIADRNKELSNPSRRYRPQLSELPMAPPKQGFWIDNNVLVKIDVGRSARATAAEKSLGQAVEERLFCLQNEGHEILFTPRVKFEFLSARTQTREPLLKSLNFTEDSLVVRTPRKTIWAWAEEGREAGLSALDADVIAQVKAGALARDVTNPNFLTMDLKGLLRMRQRGVNAISFENPAMAELPTVPEIPTPKLPPPEVPIGVVTEEGFLEAAKTGFKSGLKGSLLNSETIIGVAATLLLLYADNVAYHEAIRNTETKFLKDGFARGVAAEVMTWTEYELKTELMNRVTNFRLKGLADPAGLLKMGDMFRLAQSYENYSIGVGYYYSDSQSRQWKQAMRGLGAQILSQYGYHFGRDPQALFEYDFIEKLAWVLQPTTDAIIKPHLTHKWSIF